ncbi:MAG: polysaccharide deacetylase family protein [Bacteroidales bacterium]|nr:polysaccharide deacetylase family protein [Bacteroidales bacterium]
MKAAYSLAKLVYPGAIRRIENQKNTIFFTFDDGPDPQVTPQVLYLLNRFGAKATFFCLGQNVEKYPTLFNEIKAQGHSIGNHGYAHIDGFKCTNDEFLKNAEKGYFLTHSRLFRPPYGRMKPIQYQWVKRRYKIVLWDTMSEDYDEKKSATEIINHVTSSITHGSIVVFHDTLQAQKNLFEVLPVLLSQLSHLIFDKIPMDTPT